MKYLVDIRNKMLIPVKIIRGVWKQPLGEFGIPYENIEDLGELEPVPTLKMRGAIGWSVMTWDDVCGMISEAPIPALKWK